jgi:hypothetical protein
MDVAGVVDKLGNNTDGRLMSSLRETPRKRIAGSPREASVGGWSWTSPGRCEELGTA